MKRAVWITAIAAAMLSFGLTLPTSAEMRSATLGVQMYCPSCSYMLQRSLRAVPGVLDVIVSLERQSALVVYDDAETSVSELVAAPASIGYETTVLAGTEARLRDPRGSTSSLKPGEEEDPLWIYLRSLLSGLEPESP